MLGGNSDNSLRTVRIDNAIPEVAGDFVFVRVVHAVKGLAGVTVSGDLAVNLDFGAVSTLTPVPAGDVRFAVRNSSGSVLGSFSGDLEAGAILTFVVAGEAGIFVGTRAFIDEV